MKIVVHVDRLVLDGFGNEPGEAEGIRRGVERELATLLASAPRAAFSGGAVAHIRVPRVRIQPGARPAATGARIAAAVSDGIRCGTARTNP